MIETKISGSADPKTDWMNAIEKQVAPILSMDFFTLEDNFASHYESDRIAEIINGQIYLRTKKRVEDFIERSNQTLFNLKTQVDQTAATVRDLDSKVRSTRPIEPKLGMFDSNNPEAIEKFNREVEEYNSKLELNRRMIDQANRARERCEDTIAKYNEKKPEIEEQIKVKMEDLKPALDQDILAALGKLQQLAYDNLKNKQNRFAGFVISYLAKKAYIFLYDYIDTVAEQRAATDIFSKLNDEFNTILESNSEDVKEGLYNTASFLSECYHNNEVLLESIKKKLNNLPYQVCTDNTAEINSILQISSDTSFSYKEIIDPIELSNVASKVQLRKEEFQGNIEHIDKFSLRFEPTFVDIAAIKDLTNKDLIKMKDNKSTILDPVIKDTSFILSVFNEEDQDNYLKKHKSWFVDLKKSIEESLQVDLNSLITMIPDTELLTKTANTLLDSDKALNFLTNKEKIAEKRADISDGIIKLDLILNEINELPKKKAEECKKKATFWLIISLLPIGNLISTFILSSTMKQFLPAFSSTNTFYMALRSSLIKMYTIFSIIHGILAVTSGIAAFLMTPEMQIPLIIGTILYLASSILLFLSGVKLKKLIKQ